MTAPPVQLPSASGDRRSGARRRPGRGVAAVRREHDAAGRGVHVAGRHGLGAAALLRGVVGLPRPRRGRAAQAGVTQRGHAVGDVRRAARAGRRRVSLAAFANTCRHRGHELLAGWRTSRTSARSSAPTTRGATTSTGSLIAAPGFGDVDVVRPGRARAGPAAGARPGTAGCSSTRSRQRRRRSRSTSAVSTDLVAPYGPERWCSVRLTTTRWRPTGRWSPRTTTSATTAR